MIVYRDILSGDEMITDAFKLLPVVDKEGATVRNICNTQNFPKSFMLISSTHALFDTIAG